MKIKNKKILKLITSMAILSPLSFLLSCGSPHNATEQHTIIKQTKLVPAKTDFSAEELDKIIKTRPYQTADEIAAEDEKIISKYKSVYNLSNVLEDENDWGGAEIKGVTHSVSEFSSSDIASISFDGGPLFIKSYNDYKSTKNKSIDKIGIKKYFNDINSYQKIYKMYRNNHPSNDYGSWLSDNSWNGELWNGIPLTKKPRRDWYYMNKKVPHPYSFQPARVYLMSNFASEMYSDNYVKEMNLLSLATIHKKIKNMKKKYKQIILNGVSYGSSFLLDYLARYGTDGCKFVLYSSVINSGDFSELNKSLCDSNQYKYTSDLVENKSDLDSWINAIYLTTSTNGGKLQNATRYFFNLKMYNDKKFDINSVYVLLGGRDDFIVDLSNAPKMPKGYSFKVYDNYIYNKVYKKRGVNLFVEKNAGHSLMIDGNFPIKVKIGDQVFEYRALDAIIYDNIIFGKNNQIKIPTEWAEANKWTHNIPQRK